MHSVDVHMALARQELVPLSGVLLRGQVRFGEGMGIIHMIPFGSELELKDWPDRKYGAGNRAILIRHALGAVGGRLICRTVGSRLPDYETTSGVVIPRPDDKELVWHTGPVGVSYEHVSPHVYGALAFHFAHLVPNKTGMRRVVRGMLDAFGNAIEQPNLPVGRFARDMFAAVRNAR